MDREDSMKNIPAILMPHLEGQESGNSGSIAVIMCGASGLSSTTSPCMERILTGKGAGKSTLSSAIVDAFPSFTRLSIDAIVADRHGIYNVDYPPSQYVGLRCPRAKARLSLSLNELHNE